MKSKTEIQCPACKTRFKVDLAKIPAKGCQATCKKCKKPFFVARPPSPAAAPAPPTAEKVNSTAEAGSYEKADPANSNSEAKAASANTTPAKKTVPASSTPASNVSESQPAKPGNKKNFLLVGGLAGLMLLICVGVVFFLTQKYNFQVTSKNSDRAAAEKTTPDTIAPSVAVQPAVVTSEETENVTDPGNTGINIGNLFNQVNLAVGTVLTYDSGNNLFKQGSGFFINPDGDFITNYHVLKGAYSAVIKFKEDIEYKAEFVLAANEKNDLIKLSVNIPGGALKQGAWLEINANQPKITDKIIVIGTPMGLGRTVSDGIISAIREIPDRGLAFQMTAPISRGSSGSPVIDMNGQVVGVAFFQILNGQNLNFSIPAENILAMQNKRPLSIAAWTEKVSEDRNENLAMLQKGIVKHIKHDNSDDKKEKDVLTEPTNGILKAKMAAEIIKESGIAKQTHSLTEMVLASFDEKYQQVDTSKSPLVDEKLARSKDVIKLATNPQRMNEYIRKHLASRLSIPEMEQVLKWYKSPLGKKIAELEYSSYTEKKEHVNTLRLAFRLSRYQNTSRANLFSRLDEATNSTEAMSELQTSLIIQNQILSMVLSDSDKVDQASIDEIIKKFETDIDPYLDILAAEYIFAGFVYTYRGLSETELEEYLSFSETKAARQYYFILKTKSNAILLDSNKRILTSIIRVLNEDSWVNIQKDLDKPFIET